jgi:virginiamycin A acetyltransferase
MWRAQVRRIVKRASQGLSLVIVFPFAAICAFGRIPAVFQTMGQFFALIPGLPGDYLRIAFYSLTLAKCSLDSRISFGSFFARSSALVGRGVYIGPYCVMGNCDLADRTLIAAHVQILSGRHQHVRFPDGRLLSTNEKELIQISIGQDCWIGASSIIMANVGARTTIGSGTVVVSEIPSDVVAVGNPARILSTKQSLVKLMETSPED